MTRARTRRHSSPAHASSAARTPDYADVVSGTAGRSTRRRLLSLFRPYRLMAAGCVVLVIAQIGLSTVPPLLLRLVIDDALPRRDTDYLAVLCIGMFAAAVLATVFGIIQSVAINRLTQSVIHRLRVAVYDRVQRMPLPFFSANPVSEVETRIISDLGGISAAVSLTAQNALAASIQVVAALGAMLYLNWLLAVIASSLGLVLSVITERAGRRRRRLAMQLQDTTSSLMFALSEDLSAPGVLLGRTMMLYPRQRRRFDQLSAELSHLVFRQRLTGTGIRSVVGIAFAALPPLLYFLAGTTFSHVSIGTVVVLTTLQARLSSPLQQLLGYTSSMASISAMLERTFEYVDLQPEMTLPARHRERIGESRDVSLHGVEYSYPDQPEPALNEITASFPARSLTVVVGQTGSGKSTLALLLSGQLRPAAGEVQFDGQPLGPEQLWSYVTLVPQETVLFNTSLRENLMFAAPYADEARLEAALIAAGLGERLLSLPDGLDSEVGDRGDELSGGERQRVGLARAILDPAPVLVFDEPTSAVDNETAAHLHVMLVELARRRTVVFITHRIPVLDGNQRVLVLDHGRVVESGTHEQLSAAGGYYAELVDLQFSTEELPPDDAAAAAKDLARIPAQTSLGGTG